MDVIIPILVAAITAGTPLVFAALGELITEKSGVLNLGVEGMMLVGAVCGFAVAADTGNLWLGVAASVIAGIAMSLIFAVLVLNFLANQVAAGLALTIFGVGLSSFLGLDYTSVVLDRIQSIHIPILSDMPIFGALLFSYDLLVYFSVFMFLAVSWFLYKSRAGLLLRAIGESPDAAHALGYNVIGVRYLAVMFGGGMAGLGGAYLAIVYTPLWVEGMTAGRGWISLALVVFATWRPARVLAGAYLFGAATIAGFYIQGAGYNVSSQILSTLPYLVTIIVLVLISRNINLIRLNAPISLGKPWHITN